MRAVGGAPTPLIRTYQAASTLLGPAVYGRVSRRLRAQGISEPRIAERVGFATMARPAGQLVWFHGASVGESLSVLTLIRGLGRKMPTAEFLITSGTATSADIVGKRLPPRTRHQFAPLDIPTVVERFYNHWKPDAGIFVESELWPNLLLQARRSEVPLALVNARLSPKSVQGWQRWPGTARQVLNVFSVMLAQNRDAADNLVAMGGDPARVRVGLNLKATSDPLPVDEDTRAAIATAIGDRPVWVASSTHPGEEEIVLDAHARLLRDIPDLCLILAPRHPERGAEVATLIQDRGLSTARRSTGESPDAQTAVYLADTMGEVGTWYALAAIVFLGGSLKPIGGHNPFEPAHAGAAILTGPHVTNFSETFTPLTEGGGAQVVEDADDLSRAVSRWLTDPGALDTARQAARIFAQDGQDALDGIADLLCRKLDLDVVA
jgi:3-deoxy-D-manno-octulosonic-acid transferase